MRRRCALDLLLLMCIRAGAIVSRARLPADATLCEKNPSIQTTTVHAIDTNNRKCAIKIGYRLDLLRAFSAQRRMYSSYNQVFGCYFANEQQRHNKIKHLNCVVVFLGFFSLATLMFHQSFTIVTMFCTDKFII